MANSLKISGGNGSSSTLAFSAGNSNESTIRFSLKNFGEKDGLKPVPLCVVFCV